MDHSMFIGTGVALVTPFNQGKIDFLALERIIEHVIEGGIDYIVSLGTTGEAVTLSTKECRKVLDFTIQIVDKRIPIVAGLFGGNNTRQLIDRIDAFKFDGIDAIMSSSPAYVKPSQEGLFQHYMAIEKVAPRPIIIYNVPGRTASNITAETTLRLAKESSKFMAIKEASGDLVQAMKIIKNKPDNFLVISGDDPTALALTACGGSGIISVIANAYPTYFSEMTQDALKANLQNAQLIQMALLDVHPWLYLEGNPVGIKAAMQHLNLLENREVRLPLSPMSEKNYIKLKRELERVTNYLALVQ